MGVPLVVGVPPARGYPITGVVPQGTPCLNLAGVPSSDLTGVTPQSGGVLPWLDLVGYPQLDLARVPPSWTWLGYPPGQGACSRGRSWDDFYACVINKLSIIDQGSHSYTVNLKHTARFNIKRT